MDIGESGRDAGGETMYHNFITQWLQQFLILLDSIKQCFYIFSAMSHWIPVPVRGEAMGFLLVLLCHKISKTVASTQPLSLMPLYSSALELPGFVKVESTRCWEVLLHFQNHGSIT